MNYLPSGICCATSRIFRVNHMYPGTHHQSCAAAVSVENRNCTLRNPLRMLHVHLFNIGKGSNTSIVFGGLVGGLLAYKHKFEYLRDQTHQINVLCGRGSLSLIFEQCFRDQGCRIWQFTQSRSYRNQAHHVNTPVLFGGRGRWSCFGTVLSTRQGRLPYHSCFAIVKEVCGP